MFYDTPNLECRQTGFGKEKLASVSAIKDVIENGTIIHSSPNHNASGVDIYVIAPRGMIDEKQAYIGVIVKSYPRVKGNAKFYLHEAQILETSKADLSSMTAPQLSVDTVDKSASNNSISQERENATRTQNSISEQSTTDSNGIELTKERQEYFKNSKIRDNQGNMKVIYHGSPAQFTVFDKKKARTSGFYGSGFYFTDSESHAGQCFMILQIQKAVKHPLQLYL